MKPDLTQPPAVVFDLGGVLIDWNPRHLYRKLFDSEESMERFLEEIGFDEWNRLQDAGRPFSIAVSELCARFPHHCSLIRAYHERYPETLKGAITGTVEILRRLYEGGFDLFALSNWPAEKFRLVQNDFQFFNWFKGMVISGDVGAAKPDLAIYQALLAQVGRPAGECLFIDDSPVNIACAEDLGFQTILFQGPECLEMDLVRRGYL